MSLIVGCLPPEPYYSRVESIWDAIADECGDNGIVNPYPHFTLYHLGAGDAEAVEATVRDAVAETDPFGVRTGGLGVFSGHHVYMPVTHSERLDRLHRTVVSALETHGPAPTAYYDPGNWFPHIALATGIDGRRVPEIVEFLLDYDLEWEFTVDTVAITHRPEDADQHELVGTVEF